MCQLHFLLHADFFAWRLHFITATTENPASERYDTIQRCGVIQRRIRAPPGSSGSRGAPCMSGAALISAKAEKTQRHLRVLVEAPR